MKYINYILAIMLGTSVLVSCGDDDDTTATGNGNNTEKPVSKPTDWTLPSNELLHYSNMTVTIDQKGLPQGIEITADDLLGAFVGDECRGSVSPVLDIDKTYRYYLTVVSTTADSNKAEVVVELRYYSAQKSHIYTTAGTFPFQANGRLGEYNASYMPTWKQ